MRWIGYVINEDAVFSFFFTENAHLYNEIIKLHFYSEYHEFLESGNNEMNA